MSIIGQGFKFFQAETVILFDEVPGIKGLINDLDTALRGMFNPGVAFSVGEDADPNIPRIRYQSVHGHSTLLFGTASVRMITQFDANYSSDFKKIKEYCLERAATLESVLEKSNILLRWGAVILKLHLPFAKDVKPEESSEKIRKLFFSENPLVGKNDQLHELSFKSVSVDSNKYFINSNIQNFKAYTGVFGGQGKLRLINIPMHQLTLDEYGIEIAIDVNSKYAFDFTKDSKHSKEDFPKILSLIENTLENKIGKIKWQ